MKFGLCKILECQIIRYANNNVNLDTFSSRQIAASYFLPSILHLLHSLHPMIMVNDPTHLPTTSLLIHSHHYYSMGCDVEYCFF